MLYRCYIVIHCQIWILKRNQLRTSWLFVCWPLPHSSCCVFAHTAAKVSIISSSSDLRVRPAVARVLRKRWCGRVHPTHAKSHRAGIVSRLACDFDNDARLPPLFVHPLNRLPLKMPPKSIFATMPLKKYILDPQRTFQWTVLKRTTF